MDLEKIIGNGEIKELLTKTVQTDKVLHSYLLIGKDGIGKKQIAIQFAKMILCQNEEVKPCNCCKSCAQMDSKNHPDFDIILPDGKTIKIEQIRNLQNRVAEKPIISNRKVYIIDQSNLMTKEAQNCLLKTLEEPPEYVTLILITSNEASILNTIKSRCTKLVFRQLSNEEIKGYIKSNLKIDKISSNLLELIGGSIGKAYEIQEKIELYEKIEELADKIEDVDKIELFKQAEFIYKNKEQIDEILDYLNVIFLSQAKKGNYQYLDCIRQIEQTKRNLTANANFDMSVDHMLLKVWEEVNR